MNYDWVTAEMFQEKLADIVSEAGSAILSVPGVYEACAEHFNNAVLDALTEEREAQR